MKEVWLIRRNKTRFWASLIDQPRALYMIPSNLLDIACDWSISLKRWPLRVLVLLVVYANHEITVLWVLTRALLLRKSVLDQWDGSSDGHTFHRTWRVEFNAPDQYGCPLTSTFVPCLMNAHSQINKMFFFSFLKEANFTASDFLTFVCHEVKAKRWRFIKGVHSMVLYRSTYVWRCVAELVMRNCF